jgi:hypothetical protein
MYQFLSWFGSRGYHEIPEFEDQKSFPMIYVRDTIDKFVLCENYTIQFTTKDAGLMQPNQLSKPVLELLTQGKRIRHRVILQLLAVILHLFLSKTVYENYTKINFENLGFVYKLSKMMKIVRNVDFFENLGSKISKC